MTETAGNQPQINRKYTLPALFGLAGAYAWFLTRTETGKLWAQEQTWATVAAGMAVTTAAIAIEDRKAAITTGVYFAVASVPMIFVQLRRQVEQHRRIYKTCTK